MNDDERTERRVLGYILVDPNTLAIDWDGVIHETKADAIKEAVSAMDVKQNDTPRPEIDSVWYRICEVRDIDTDDDVVREAQKQWDAHQDWLAS